MNKVELFSKFVTLASHLLDNPMDLLAYAGATRVLLRGRDTGVAHLLPRLRQLAWRICHTT